jgi:hypothetical protein
METAFTLESGSLFAQLRDLFLRKLGICRRCILTATAGMVLSWALFILLNALFDSPLLLSLVGLILLVALAFSVVWLGHMLAYYFRVLLPLSAARRNSQVVRADLTLSAADSKQVAGAFTQGTSGLSFEAAVHQENLSLSIDNPEGRNLLTLEEKEGLFEISILGGDLRISFPRFPLADDLTKEEMAAAAEEYLSQVSVFGEQDTLRRLQELPDYELLPLLSKTLGKLGFSGDRFPAAVALHHLALGALRFRHEQRRAGDEGPGDNDDQPDVVYRIKHPFQDELRVPRLMDFFDDGTVPCLPPFLNEIYLYEAGRDESWMSCGSPCKSGKGRSYPNRSDNCFGMCGPGCECWSLICGDCCYHQVCADHDTFCRSEGAKAKLACWTGFPYRGFC